MARGFAVVGKFGDFEPGFIIRDPVAVEKIEKDPAARRNCVRVTLPDVPAAHDAVKEG